MAIHSETGYTSTLSSLHRKTPITHRIRIWVQLECLKMEPVINRYIVMRLRLAAR